MTDKKPLCDNSFLCHSLIKKAPNSWDLLSIHKNHSRIKSKSVLVHNQKRQQSTLLLHRQEPQDQFSLSLTTADLPVAAGLWSAEVSSSPINWHEISEHQL